MYDEHGLVLHAIADAAGHDPEVERVYHGLIERFVDGHHDAHRARPARPAWSRRSTPRRAAGALVWMSERYLLMTLGRLPKTPVDTVVDTLGRSGCARSTETVLRNAVRQTKETPPWRGLSQMLCGDRASG